MSLGFSCLKPKNSNVKFGTLSPQMLAPCFFVGRVPDHDFQGGKSSARHSQKFIASRASMLKIFRDSTFRLRWIEKGIWMMAG
jgi:hypothetical protein